MTRKRAFAYTTIFALAVGGTLAAVNPGIAALPIGFFAVFLALFFIVLVSDWAIAHITAWHRPISFLCMLFWVTVAMGASHGPAAIAAGWIATVVVFLAFRWGRGVRVAKPV